jgi:hypothetical protein
MCNKSPFIDWLSEKIFTKVSESYPIHGKINELIFLAAIIQQIVQVQNLSQHRS